MVDLDCYNAKIQRADSVGLLVRDVMIARPKTLSIDSNVAAARKLFENPHVLTLLLVSGTSFAGALNRGALPATCSDDEPLGALVSPVTTIAADAAMTDAVALLDSAGENRLVVLAEDGQTLAGLLCLDRDRTGFCQ